MRTLSLPNNCLLHDPPCKTPIIENRLNFSFDKRIDLDLKQGYYLFTIARTPETPGNPFPPENEKIKLRVFRY